MKIKYDFNDKYKKYYREVYSIVAMKNKLKKNPNKRINDYVLSMTLQCSLCLVVYLALAVLYMDKGSGKLSNIFIDIAVLIIFVYVILIVAYLATAPKKNNEHDGVLEINEEGVIDKGRNGLLVGFSYEQIDLIVITNNVIVFLAKSPIMIYINYKNADKDKIINKIKKYSDVQIIDKTTIK